MIAATSGSFTSNFTTEIPDNSTHRTTVNNNNNINNTRDKIYRAIIYGPKPYTSLLCVVREKVSQRQMAANLQE